MTGCTRFSRSRTRRQGFSLAPLLMVLTLWSSASAPPAAAQDASPTIELSAKSGPPTTPLVVSGDGFCPHERVHVYLDAEIASVVTGDRGRFSALVRVPASALPQKHWVVAVSRCSRKHTLARFLVRTDWSQFHFDPQHNGLNPFENVLDPGNVSGLKPAWSAKNQGIFYSTSSSPAVVNGMV